MAVRGIGAFHENAAPHIGPEYEVDLVREAADEVGLRATVYWGELVAFDTAWPTRVSASPATWSPTAPSAPAPRRSPRRTPTGPTTAATATSTPTRSPSTSSPAPTAGVQAGFHCDRRRRARRHRRGLRRRRAGSWAPRAPPARHRLEHVEMPSVEAVATFGRLQRDRQRPADVRRPVGWPRRDVRRTAGPDGGAT